MIRFFTVLAIVLFFMGSIGLGHRLISHAMGLDRTDKQIPPIESRDRPKKKMKDNQLQSEETRALLAQKSKPEIARNQAGQLPKPAALKKTETPASRTQSSKEDLLWLAKIIHAEAKGEPFKGKVAVGAVILNRVEHKEFPKSIYKVIHQQRKGRYQFQPVANGKIKNSPDKASLEAAKLALKGTDPTDGALYFYNPKISRSSWMSRLTEKTRIGNHVFASN